MGFSCDKDAGNYSRHSRPRPQKKRATRQEREGEGDFLAHGKEEGRDLFAERKSPSVNQRRASAVTCFKGNFVEHKGI
jgi:hypothetical protein